MQATLYWTLLLNKSPKCGMQTKIDTINAYMPWKEIEALVGDYYYANQCPAKGGRPRTPLIVHLRIYILCNLLAMSEEMMHFFLHHTYPFVQFTNVDSLGSIPSVSSMIKFRHFMEENHLCEKVFYKIVDLYTEKNLVDKTITVTDSTIIPGSSSTKNIEGKRDPDKRSTKKGNNWYFGTKLHIFMSYTSRIVYKMVVTPANVHDLNVLAEHLDKGVRYLYGDSGYLGAPKRESLKLNNGRCTYFIAQRRKSKPKGIFANNPEAYKAFEKFKSSIRSRVEHFFDTIKNKCGCKKIIYRGKIKIEAKLFITGAISNVFAYSNLVKKGLINP